MSKIINYIKNLPEDELDKLKIEVWSSEEKEIQILSIYLSEDGKSLIIDVDGE